MDELDQKLEADKRHDRTMIVLASCLCVAGTLWGFLKLAGVHFTLYPHHWPF